MAFCSNCGQELADGAKFCSACGKSTNAGDIVQPIANVNQRKVSFDGEIYKCPSCGEVLNSFTSNCPSCGYELRGTKVTNSVQELVRKLEELEGKRSTTQSCSSFLQRKLNGKTLDVIDEQKINLIRNFPIPNSKEDIREFLIIASSNMQVQAYGSKEERFAQEAIAKAWELKYNQAQKKAKISFGWLAANEEIRLINENAKKGSGWKAWSLPAKIGWIILNIYTIGIPAIIYSICRK